LPGFYLVSLFDQHLGDPPGLGSGNFHRALLGFHFQERLPFFYLGAGRDLHVHDLAAFHVLPKLG
jgi:hypothetical protein